jgi:hypothetical protein
LITELRNTNDQIENNHLNWENGAVSEKNYSLPSSSETVSAVKTFQAFSSKSTKLFQLWGTSHGYYPSPHDACRYHRMAFSGLIKARETPRTGSGDEKKRQERREKKETENRGDDRRSKRDRNKGREQKASVPQLRLRLQNTNTVGKRKQRD